MKLKIRVTIVYPSTPATGSLSYPTRNESDNYEQEMEIEEADVKARLEKIVKAFNAFD